MEDQVYGVGRGKARFDVPWDRNSFSAARPAVESPLFSPVVSLFFFFFPFFSSLCFRSV